MWESFKAYLVSKGILTADNEAELKAEFDKSNPAPAPAGTPPGGADPNADAIARAVQAALAPVVAQVQGLSTALNAEKAARETAVQTLADQEKATRAGSIKTLLDEAEAKQKFATAERQKWADKLEKDFDGYKEALDAIPGKAAPADKGGKPTATTTTTQTTPAGTFNRAELIKDAASAFATSNE